MARITINPDDDDEQDDAEDEEGMTMGNEWRPRHVVLMAILGCLLLASVVWAAAFTSTTINRNNTLPKIERARVCQGVPDDFRVTCIEASK